MRKQIMSASIFGLAIAEGIKQLLFDNGFNSIDLIAKTTPAELAAILGIELYVARLIYLAAKKHHDAPNVQADVNDKEKIFAKKEMD